MQVLPLPFFADSVFIWRVAVEGIGTVRKLGDLFRDEPEQWGLRGDPYLWREFREKFDAVDFPNDVSDLERLLENAFWEATGKSLTFSEEFFVERFAHGGMSSGGVSGAFWRDRGFPTIVERFKAQE